MVEASPPHSVTTRIALPTLARSGLLLVLALLSYYTLFRLPFLFAPRQRLMSASYAFGFNNSVAILAMAGLLGVVTLFYLVGDVKQLSYRSSSRVSARRARRGQ